MLLPTTSALRNCSFRSGLGIGYTIDAANSGSARAARLQHELRTPLNHIIGYCEILIEQAQDTGPEAFISDLDRIHCAGKRLLAIIEKDI
jgi:signal transduction histidine kinase